MTQKCNTLWVHVIHERIYKTFAKFWMDEMEYKCATEFLRLPLAIFYRHRASNKSFVGYEYLSPSL